MDQFREAIGASKQNKKSAHNRRTHGKSRDGCLECKSRRLKVGSHSCHVVEQVNAELMLIDLVTSSYLLVRNVPARRAIVNIQSKLDCSPQLCCAEIRSNNNKISHRHATWTQNAHTFHQAPRHGVQTESHTTTKTPSKHHTPFDCLDAPSTTQVHRSHPSLIQNLCQTPLSRLPPCTHKALRSLPTLAIPSNIPTSPPQTFTFSNTLAVMLLPAAAQNLFRSGP